MFQDIAYPDSYNADVTDDYGTFVKARKLISMPYHEPS